MLRSSLNTQTYQCPKCTELHTCYVCLVGKHSHAHRNKHPYFLLSDLNVICCFLASSNKCEQCSLEAGTSHENNHLTLSRVKVGLVEAYAGHILSTCTNVMLVKLKACQGVTIWTILHLQHLLVYDCSYYVLHNWDKYIYWQFYRHELQINLDGLNIIIVIKGLTFLVAFALSLTCFVPPSDSSYWSHAGLHTPGWEKSGSATQLSRRFPQVSFNIHPAINDASLLAALQNVMVYANVF